MDLRRRWRRSLQLRTVVITALLTLGIAGVLALFLTQQITAGMFQARFEQVEAEATRGMAQVRDEFASSTATDAQTASAFALSTLRGLEGDSGATITRQYHLEPLPTSQARYVGTISSPGLDATVLPEDLRDAVAEGDGVYWASIALPQPDGTTQPGLAFGTRVVLPPGAGYALFLVYDLADLQQTLDFVMRVLLVAGVMLPLLNILVAVYVTRSVVRPVSVAASTAESLSSGDLTVRMPVEGEDEMARLGSSFNTMADNLQDQITRMAQLSAMQQRFVSDVSHELRTPLTTVRMAADVLYDSRDDFDPVNRRSTELLYHQVDRFQAMLADLLEITRFDAGAAVIKPESTDMLELTADVVLTAQPLAANADVEVYIVPQHGAPFVADVDSRRIERILRNLVNNAIEHAEGRPVDVVIAGDADVVSVAVRDHGIGMDEEQVAMVFNRFWRADPARNRTTGGSGLGLSIATEDTRLHHGTLQAWGELGEGSCFLLTIPRTYREDGPGLDARPEVRPALGLPPDYDIHERRRARDLDAPVTPAPEAAAAEALPERQREQALLAPHSAGGAGATAAPSPQGDTPEESSGEEQS